LGDGVAVVPARLFADIVKALEPGAVTVEIEEDAQISSGRFTIFCAHVAASEFPHLNEPSGEPFTIDASVFSDALRQVVVRHQPVTIARC